MTPDVPATRYERDEWDERWRVLSAAVAGADHIRRGEACRDSFAVEQAHGAFIAAVAAGGSELRLSAAGATFAATMAVEATRRLLSAATEEVARGPDFWRGLVCDLAQGSPEGVRATYPGGCDALSRGGAPRLRHHPHTGGRGPAVAGRPLHRRRLRSGPLRRRPLRPAAASRPRSGSGCGPLSEPAPAPAPAVFVSSPHAAEAAHTLVARIADVTGIALATRGLRERGLVYENTLAHFPREGFFDPIFARADTDRADTTLPCLLAAEPTADDATLVVGVPRQPPSHHASADVSQREP